MHTTAILKRVMPMALALSCAALTQAQTAPVISLALQGSNYYSRLSPDTKAGLGASAAVGYGGAISLAMKGMGNSYLYTSVTTDGVNVTTVENTSIQLNYAPSLAIFNNLLYLAYTDLSGGVQLLATGDGLNFSHYATIYTPSGTGTDVAATGPPTLVVYNGTLYAYWETDFAGGNFIRVAQSTAAPGIWNVDSGPCGGYQPAQATSHAAVGAAVFNGNLYVGIQKGSSTTSNTLVVCNSGSYTEYTNIHPEGGIAAAIFNNSLYFAYKSNTSANYLEITGTEDGLHFTAPGTQYTAIRINGQTGYEIAPALVPYNGLLYIFNTANDNTHYLYQEHSN